MSIKMTREQLIDTIELLLSCCISKLTDHFPDQLDITERQKMVHPSTGMSEYERGIVQQTIWSIACLTAQVIDDGVGEGDTDVMLGMFSEQCAKFIAANWEGYGQSFLDRMEKALGLPHENINGAGIKDYCLHHPDARQLAESFVTALGDIELPTNIETGTRSSQSDQATIAKLRSALESVTRVAGNLPDEHITDRTGPNDAKQRGLMVVMARDIAKAALKATEPQPIPSEPHSILDGD